MVEDGASLHGQIVEEARVSFQVQQYFNEVCAVIGAFVVFCLLGWATLALAELLIDKALELFGVSSEVYFYLKHRQRIRGAIGKDPEMLAKWEQWRNMWTQKRR